MKKLSLGIAILAAISLAACQPTTKAAAAPDTAAKIERGRYLVSFGSCNDCHTPLKMTDHGPEPDMTRMLSGHPAGLVMTKPPKLGESPWVWLGAGTNTAFAGPWGVTYAFNLTPDQATGLGIWTEEMFIKTMRTGRHMGTSRPINPPMPWFSLNSLSDDDLKAVYAYLRSIPAIKNLVPSYLEPSEAESELK